MKKYFVLLFCSLFIIISCKQKSNSQIISFDKNETLKSILNELESDTIWTRELEPEIMEQSLSNTNGISNNIMISQETSILNKVQNEKVYPSITNFTILDTSELDKDIKLLIENFSNSVCKDFQKSNTQYLNPEFTYSYIFFKSNLYENWYIMFNEEFPYSFEEINGTKKIKLFNSFLIGKFEENDDFIQIPVRFYSDEKYINTNIFVDKQNKKSICDINIIGWGK